MKNKSMNYLVIIGDIQNSREIKNRELFQKRFAKTLETTQKTFGSSIVSPLTLTLGDEFQTVLNNASGLFELTTHIEILLEDTPFRFGIGLGKIVTEINYKNSIGMDGPAFHFARMAIEEARVRKKQYCFYSSDETKNREVGLLLDWINSSTRQWSRLRKKIRYYFRRQYNQRELAAKLGVSQPSISQNINDEIFKLVISTQIEIQKKLNRYLKETDSND